MALMGPCRVRGNCVHDPLSGPRALTLKRQGVLATPVHASDSCQLRGRAGSVKAVFAGTLTKQLVGCGCPAVADGLDGFWSARTIRQREHGHPPRLNLDNCCSHGGPRDCVFRASRPA